MTVIWLDRALFDLEDVRAYIAEDDPGAAEALTDRIMGATRTLADFPQRGRIGRLRGTRELVVPRTPYLVVYRLREDAVEILRLIHGARQWPPL